jgi:hypothetical protein
MECQSDALYWAGVLGSAAPAIIVVSVGTGVASLFACIGSFMDDNPKPYRIAAAIFVPVFLLLLMLAVFVPTEREYRAMKGLPRIPHTHTCACPVVVEHPGSKP